MENSAAAAGKRERSDREDCQGGELHQIVKWTGSDQPVGQGG